MRPVRSTAPRCGTSVSAADAAARAGFVILLVAACGEAGGPVETEHLDIHVEDDLELCVGHFAQMERELVRVASELGAQPPSNLEVHVVADAADPCGEPPQSCALGRGGAVEVWANLESMSHEFVHAVRLGADRFRGPFFEEGIAEAVGGGRPRLGYWVDLFPTEVAQPAELARDDYDAVSNDHYVVGSHFLLWLRDRYGMAPIQAFLFADDYEDDQLGAFERELGMSIDEASDTWRAESEFSYFAGEYCEADRLFGTLSAPIEVEGELHCDNDETLGPKARSRKFCFTTLPGSIRIEVDADEGQLFLRAHRCRTEPGIENKQRWYPAGAVVEEELPDCDWWADYFHDGDPDDAVAFRAVISPL